MLLTPYPAIELYKKALESDPNDAAPLPNMAAAYYEAGLYPASLEHCERAVKLKPNDHVRNGKLAIRATKSRVLLKKYDDAVVSLGETSGPEALAMRSSLVKQRDRLGQPSLTVGCSLAAIEGISSFKSSLYAEQPSVRLVLG